MKHYKWLERAAAKPDKDGDVPRPVLSWGHVGQWGERPCMYATDGYRVHVVFGTLNTDMGSFPFAFSQGPQDAAMIPMRPPNMQGLYDSIKTPTLEINIKVPALRRFLRGMVQPDFSTCVYLIVRGGTILLVSDAMILHCNDFMTTEQPVDVCVAFNVDYLHEALKGTETAILRICAENSSAPLIVDMGDRLALIMPMGSMDHWDNNKKHGVNGRTLTTLEAIQGLKLDTLQKPKTDLKFIDDPEFSAPFNQPEKPEVTVTEISSHSEERWSAEHVD